MNQRGFSLKELMVVIGILVLVNSIILSNYPEFNRRMALKKTSEEVALIARQAQAYSLGVKRSVSGGEIFGFGVHFGKSALESKSLILFTDLKSSSNKIYDAGAGCGKPITECFQEFKIDTGDYVSNLQTCNSSSICSSVSTLDVVYPRASSIAAISADRIVCGSCSYARVTIKSSKMDKYKIIKIWINGTITVE